jgi:hypothetical protein
VTITAASCGAPEASLWSLGWISPPTSWPSSTCTEDVRSFRLVNEFKAFFVEHRCIDWYYEGRCHAGPWILAHYFATTVTDPLPPTLGQPQGTMLSDGVKRGRQGIAIHAQDVGGGLSGFSVSANGIEAAPPKNLECDTAFAQNPSVFGTVAASTTPCPKSAEANWTIDTGAFPFHDGVNKVQVCASDFATLGDPNTSCAPTQTVNVDNSCTESPVAGGEVLSAQFSESRDDTVTVGFGRSAEVSGRLANDAGDPIRGASICVKAQTPGVDPRPREMGSVMTDAEGRYTYKVAPGPNREIVVGYRHDADQVARDVSYYARARATLHLHPARVRNGERVRFWGELPGPNGGGRVVVLQASAAGSKRWLTFRKATSNGRGIFHSDYRFNSTPRTTRYRFRALVPRQSGYPWEAGRSRPVEVVVSR